MSFSSSIKLTAKISDTQTSEGINLIASVTQIIDEDFDDATNAYSENFSIDSSGETIDLAAITDILGNNVTVDSIYAILIRNKSTTVGETISIEESGVLYQKFALLSTTGYSVGNTIVGDSSGAQGKLVYINSSNDAVTVEILNDTLFTDTEDVDGGSANVDFDSVTGFDGSTTTFEEIGFFTIPEDSYALHIFKNGLSLSEGIASFKLIADNSGDSIPTDVAVLVKESE
jgi:hypothetical protein